MLQRGTDGRAVGGIPKLDGMVQDADAARDDPGPARAEGDESEYVPLLPGWAERLAVGDLAELHGAVLLLHERRAAVGAEHDVEGERIRLDLPGRQPGDDAA